MIASYNGHLEIVKWLLQNGANINDKVRDGRKEDRLINEENHEFSRNDCLSVFSSFLPFCSSSVFIQCF
jgi:ankyrin repeat protein